MGRTGIKMTFLWGTILMKRTVPSCRVCAASAVLHGIFGAGPVARLPARPACWKKAQIISAGAQTGIITAGGAKLRAVCMGGPVSEAKMCVCFGNTTQANGGLERAA
eukprot:GGOE01046299.1.p2 GENE.GGOE01046299.1~~GGOE01046299.1.p2  ORF type:complete len:107 (+),score=1.26 GGOE01046299.1:208-528(+)